MDRKLKEKFTIEKTAFSVIKLHDDHSSVDYWSKQTYEKRLAALEFLRQSWHDYDSNTERLPRF